MAKAVALQRTSGTIAIPKGDLRCLTSPAITESPRKEDTIIDPDQLDAPRSIQPGSWAWPDRIRLIIWVVIAFILPAPFIIALHLSTKSTGALFSVQSELPIKAVTAFFVVLATWIVSRKEKRPLSDYGIPLNRTFHKRFWEGTAWGFAMLSGILLLLRASGHFRIDSVALTGGAVFRYGLGWAAVFLAVAVTEEFEYRGYLLFSLSKRMRFWPAALSTSFIFAVAHLGNLGENALGILQIVATGLLFCLTIGRTGNLWFAVGFHAAWDWAETFSTGRPTVPGLASADSLTPPRKARPGSPEVRWDPRAASSYFSFCFFARCWFISDFRKRSTRIVPFKELLSRRQKQRYLTAK